MEKNQLPIARTSAQTEISTGKMDGVILVSAYEGRGRGWLLYFKRYLLRPISFFYDETIGTY